MSDKIKEGLAKLDPKNDNHWTEDGLPRIETMRLLAGMPSLTREQIIEADPSFNRTTAATPAESKAAPVPPAPPKEPVLAAEAATVGVAPVAQADPREDILKKLEELEPMLDTATSALNQAKEHHARLMEMRDALHIALERLEPPEHKRNMSAIQAYQAAANKERQARGEKWQVLKDAGIRLKDIIPQRAPIDQARQNRKK